MKILWLTTDRSQRVAQLFDPLRREVEKLADVTTITGGVWHLADVARGRRDVPRVLPELANGYDIVFTDAPFAFLGERWKDIAVPKVMLVEDQHGPYVPQYVGACLDAGFRHVFIRYRHGAESRLPRLFGVGQWPIPELPVWLPHCIDPAVFHPWTIEKTIPALMTGSASPSTYPLRAAISDCVRRHPDLGRVVERPAEKDVHSEPRGRAYAELLASARLSFATGAIYDYVVAKYFEIAACRTALASEVLPDLEALGFVPGVHYFPLDRHKLLRDQIRAMLDDENLGVVAANGHDLVMARHTADRRARELLEHFERIVS